MSVDYQSLFNALPGQYIAILPNDPLFTIVAENNAHAKVAMSDPKNVIGKPLFDSFPDTSDKYKQTGVSDLIESLRRVIKTGEPDAMEPLRYDLKDASGEYVERWWRATHYPLLDNGGNLELIFQSTEDVTKERIATKQFELAQGQLDSALAIGLVSTWCWDIERDVVIGDENLARSFGVNPDMAAAGVPIKLFVDSIAEEDRDRVVKAIQQSVKDDIDYEQEYKTIGKNNEVHWVIARGSVQKDAEGNPTYFLGVIVDITQRRKAQAQLDESRVMFSALFESSMLSIALADTKGNIIDANKTFLKTFGYTKRDLQKGLRSIDITPKRAVGITAKIYDELRRTGEAKPVEKEYVRKDGTILPMLVGAAMLPNSKDRFLAYMLDLSENKELRALNQAKDEFIGMASHQLRTPATAVKQYLSLLTTGFSGPLTEDQQMYTDKAYHANERQIEIINDLLKIAQIDSDRFTFKYENINATQLLTRAVNDTEDVLVRKNQTLIVRDKLKQVQIHVDATELHLVLVNLIENASKYSPEGTTVTIEAGRRAGYVTFSIRDEGIGISAEDQKRIFEKFTRANSKLSNTVTGSGLGLYWVEKIVRLHGGSVKLRSSVGAGSTFIVSIPYER